MGQDAFGFFYLNLMHETRFIRLLLFEFNSVLVYNSTFFKVKELSFFHCLFKTHMPTKKSTKDQKAKHFNPHYTCEVDCTFTEYIKYCTPKYKYTCLCKQYMTTNTHLKLN